MDGENPEQPGNTGNWQYKPNDTGAAQSDNSATDEKNQSDPDSQMLHQDEYLPESDVDQPDPAPSASVSWTASEFIAHQKSAGWYGVLVLATLAAAAVVFLITRDKITTFVILFVAVIFGVYAARKPRTLRLTVDNSGLTIGDHFYEYGQFRSFSMVQEGAFSSIVFMPLRRFMPLLTIYYDPKDEEKITDILSSRVPLDTHKFDYVDRFMQRIRF